MLSVNDTYFLIVVTALIFLLGVIFAVQRIKRHSKLSDHNNNKV